MWLCGTFTYDLWNKSICSSDEPNTKFKLSNKFSYTFLLISFFPNFAHLDLMHFHFLLLHSCILSMADYQIISSRLLFTIPYIFVIIFGVEENCMSFDEIYLCCLADTWDRWSPWSTVPCWKPFTSLPGCDRTMVSYLLFP